MQCGNGKALTLMAVLSLGARGAESDLSSVARSARLGHTVSEGNSKENRCLKFCSNPIQMKSVITIFYKVICP